MKIEHEDRSWRVGYRAAYTAKMVGKPIPRAPLSVDVISYLSGAVEGAAAGERDRKRQNQ